MYTVHLKAITGDMEKNREHRKNSRKIWKFLPLTFADISEWVFFQGTKIKIYHIFICITRTNHPPIDIAQI